MELHRSDAILSLHESDTVVPRDFRDACRYAITESIFHTGMINEKQLTDVCPLLARLHARNDLGQRVVQVSSLPYALPAPSVYVPNKAYSRFLTGRSS